MTTQSEEPMTENANQTDAPTTETESEEPLTEFAGYDLTIIGEPVLLASSVSVGWRRDAIVRSGVIALTKTRLVFLRKNNDTTVMRETDRGDITDVTIRRLVGTWQLTFKDGDRTRYFISRDDAIEAFEKPLNENAAANEAERELQDAEREMEKLGQFQVPGSIASATGINGQVHLFEDRIVISRLGTRAALSFGYRGMKEIILRDISSIGWKEPSPPTNAGYIHFGFQGGRDPVATEILPRVLSGGLIKPAGSIREDNPIWSNENAVVFTPGHLIEFQNFKHLLDQYRAEIQSPNLTAAAAPSDLDELKKLAELKEMGIVTEDEFEQKKKQLLSI